jgi:hypothetical protein
VALYSSPKTIAERYFTDPQKSIDQHVISGLRRRGRATTHIAVDFHRGIAAFTRCCAAVVRALVQLLHKYVVAIFFGGRGDTSTGNGKPFQPLLLLPLFASSLVDHLETEIQNKALCKDVIFNFSLYIDKSTHGCRASAPKSKIKQIQGNLLLPNIIRSVPASSRRTQRK